MLLPYIVIDKTFHSLTLLLQSGVCVCGGGLRVAGALTEGHRGRNVKAALGASVVLMD